MWKREAEDSVSEWCDVRNTQTAIAGYEDRRGPQAEEYIDLLEARRDNKRDWFSPKTSKKEYSSSNTLILA